MRSCSPAHGCAAAATKRRVGRRGLRSRWRRASTCLRRRSLGWSRWCARRGAGAGSVTVAAQDAGGSVRYYCVPVAADSRGASLRGDGCARSVRAQVDPGESALREIEPADRHRTPAGTRGERRGGPGSAGRAGDAPPHQAGLQLRPASGAGGSAARWPPTASRPPGWRPQMRSPPTTGDLLIGHLRGSHRPCCVLVAFGLRTRRVRMSFEMRRMPNGGQHRSVRSGVVGVRRLVRVVVGKPSHHT
ncbi:hypothetical protein SAMN05428944_0093 [Streptomyces sp. 1222.5]|nr:hypothetical protein BX260_0090 [Streptomyces sp. 5112.2]SEB53530.1 hypothetical protein SAMN05428944_0093 [Streptomyces sp. 1222.5]